MVAPYAESNQNKLAAPSVARGSTNNTPISTHRGDTLAWCKLCDYDFCKNEKKVLSHNFVHIWGAHTNIYTNVLTHVRTCMGLHSRGAIGTKRELFLNVKPTWKIIEKADLLLLDIFKYTVLNLDIFKNTVLNWIFSDKACSISS